MKRVFCVLLVVLLCLSMTGCSLFSKGNLSRTKLNERFDAYEPEVSETIPYVYFNTLIFDDVSLDFDNLIGAGTFHEVYAVQGDTVWFGYADDERTEDGFCTWNIATVRLDGTNITVCYSGVFGVGDGADKNYTQSNVGWSDHNDNGYYHEGKIVLTDGVKTVALDLQTNQPTEFAAADYGHPTATVKAEKVDSQTIVFAKDGVQKTFDVNCAKQTSDIFGDLYELEKEKNWEGVSCLSKLFAGVQVVGDKAYVFCRVLNWDGETHALVFGYDYDTNGCKYVFHRFMNDLILHRLYVVPTI